MKLIVLAVVINRAPFGVLKQDTGYQSQLPQRGFKLCDALHGLIIGNCCNVLTVSVPQLIAIKVRRNDPYFPSNALATSAGSDMTYPTVMRSGCLRSSAISVSVASSAD